MRWRYATVRIEAKGFLGGYIDAMQLGQILDSYGQAGWELVNVLETNYSEGATRDVILIFKQPATDPTDPAMGYNYPQ